MDGRFWASTVPRRKAAAFDMLQRHRGLDGGDQKQLIGERLASIKIAPVIKASSPSAHRFGKHHLHVAYSSTDCRSYATPVTFSTPTALTITRTMTRTMLNEPLGFSKYQ